MENNNEQTKKIIKEALTIVDKLGSIDPFEDDDIETIEKLIKQAKALKKNNLWKL